MLRGGVFIGVDRTGGGLPTLRAAASGAAKLSEWAVNPDLGAMDPANVHLINDAAADSIVTPDRIIDAVEAVISNGVDQLILYFAGHGLMINMLETWLLSEAPRRGDAAINVARSAAAARRGRTPHVVIISDACRTPAREIDTQSITPVSAFPNEPAGGPQKRVDVFYASAPGQAALELNTLNAQGIFTAILHDALTGVLYEAGGKEDEVLQLGGDGDVSKYVWSGPLGEYLEIAVGERLLQLQIDKDQAPTFEVQYGNRNLHWLARISSDRAMPNRPVVRGIELDDALAIPANTRSLSEIASDLVATIIERPDQFTAELDRAADEGATGFAESVISLAPAFPEPGVQAGIRVRGSDISDADSPSTGLRFDTQRVYWPHLEPAAPTNVFLRLGNDTVSVLPVLPGYTTDVHIEGQQIVAVSFEQTHLPVRRAEQVRRLRAVVTASVQRGRFRAAETGLDVARRLQALKGVDPAMAVYAGYSYFELQQHDRLAQMDEFLSEQLGGPTLFDIGLLSGRLESRGRQGMREWIRGDTVVPFFPLLSQGWEPLADFDFRDRAWFDRMQSSTLPSLWTVFDRRVESDLRHATLRSPH